ncbi:unnamed protein product [Caenorhabditis auriculariae]|uniref:Uncharacterized protein n=1 Tax=Caenorhabditis auriculariae TaxID=2777116 RepID=A0A8S1H844_9PELO|nr:unnamed protein product [Caenorhabditis auriculariae]
MNPYAANYGTNFVTLARIMLKLVSSTTRQRSATSDSNGHLVNTACLLSAARAVHNIRRRDHTNYEAFAKITLGWLVRGHQQLAVYIAFDGSALKVSRLLNKLFKSAKDNAFGHASLFFRQHATVAAWRQRRCS